MRKFRGTPRGLTLIEIMGALAVSTLLLSGVWDLFQAGMQSYHRGLQDVRMAQQAPALLTLMTRDIQRAIREQINKGCHLILTTGGTGVALRDVTPEAVREIALRELPGFGEVMRLESMKLTKNAILSRNLAVVVDKSLVICLPGKPSGAVECLSFVVGAIPHGIEVLQEVPTSC